MRIKIVDAAVRYDSPYDTKSYILVIRNALYVPSMDNNQILPFMLRKAGITVNDTPKIQMQDSTVEDHSIFFPETEIRIPLSLWGVFSYFPTTKPSLTDMTSSEEVYVLTTSRWDPHDKAYAMNEENMLDWEGQLIDRVNRQQILLADVNEDAAMAASVSIGSVEIKAVGTAMHGCTSEDNLPEPCFKYVPRGANEIASILGKVSPLLDDERLYNLMRDRAELGKFQASIGSTNATSSAYLVDEDNCTLETSQAPTTTLLLVANSSWNNCMTSRLKGRLISMRSCSVPPTQGNRRALTPSISPRLGVSTLILLNVLWI
jgi:hypothetical protein